jgi:hypothetical protein
MVKMYLLSPLLATLTVHAIATKAEDVPGCQRPDGADIDCTLQSTGVRDPSAIVGALGQAALRSLADVQGLDAMEVTPCSPTNITLHHMY